MRSKLAVVFLTMSLTAVSAEAITFVIRSFPRPVVLLVVGSFGASVSTVGFNVPGANIGDSTPIRGQPDIRLLLLGRAAPPNSRVVTLTADSSIPLDNGTSTIPFTEISWVSTGGGVPSGSFNGATQTLVTFLNSRAMFSRHRFFYANSNVLEAGVYRGRVTYTLSMP